MKPKQQKLLFLMIMTRLFKKLLIITVTAIQQPWPQKGSKDADGGLNQGQWHLFSPDQMGQLKQNIITFKELALPTTTTTTTKCCPTGRRKAQITDFQGPIDCDSYIRANRQKITKTTTKQTEIVKGFASKCPSYFFHWIYASVHCPTSSMNTLKTL